MRRSTLATALLLLVQTDACTDLDNGATDTTNDGCSVYSQAWCGSYDDADFSSNTMCCACGGGSPYQVLTTEGATCEPGLEITSVAECEAAIKGANAAMGFTTGWQANITVDSAERSYEPKGCYTKCGGGDLSTFYFCGDLNTHATGSGTGSLEPTMIGTYEISNPYLYLHCHSGVDHTVPAPDCTTACGDPGWSNTGAPAVAGRCYKCYNPSGLDFNCPSADYRNDRNGLLGQKDECCDKRSCTIALPPSPPSPPPPPSPSPPPPPLPSPPPPPSPSPPPPPSPSPPPIPTQASAHFTVDGPCTVDGACVRSPNHPSNYGNSQDCTIRPTSLAVGQLLSATAGFNTESGYDKLYVNGVEYDGTTGPDGVVLSTGPLTWSSDSAIALTGWEVCAAPIGTMPDPGCTTACGDPGWSSTGAPAVAGRCYKCYNPSGTSFNCPSADYRYDGNGLLLQKDDCCDKYSCTIASPPPPPSPSPPPPPSPQPPPPPSPSPPPAPSPAPICTGYDPGTYSSSCSQSCSGSLISNSCTGTWTCAPYGCNSVCPGYKAPATREVPCPSPPSPSPPPPPSPSPPPPSPSPPTITTSASPPEPPPPAICYETSPGTATTCTLYSSSTRNGVTTVTCSPIGCRSTCPGYVAAGTQQEVPCPSPSPPTTTTTPMPTTTPTPTTSATKTIVLTLTASGTVSDYSDTTALRRSLATSAGVDPSSIVIEVAAASVIITATITVPASSAASVQNSLSSRLGTAAAASAALDITVESDPTVTISTASSPKPKALTDAGPSNVETGSDSSSMGPIIGGAGEQTAPPCNLAALSPATNTAPFPPPLSRHTVGGVAAVAALIGAGVYVTMRARNPRGGGQAQGGVTLSAPAQSAGENKI